MTARKGVDAETGKWLTNKTVAVVVIFISTLTFYVGNVIPGLSNGSTSFTKIEERLDKLEQTVAKQEVAAINIEHTLSRLHEDMKEGFRDMRADIRDQRSQFFGRKP